MPEGNRNSAEDPTAAQTGQPNERILLVHPEEPIRESISSMLSAAGYKVRQAASGLEALAMLIRIGEFELLVTELLMAEVDGIVLLERAKERFPDMPVIVVTSVYDLFVALATIRNGAYDYLPTPIEHEQLLAVV